jgi:hypothetical protein
MADIGLIYRLEAATSRLEDMAMSYDDPSASKSLGGSSSSVPASPEPAQATPPPPAAPAADPVPPQIQDFDALIKGDVQNFVNLGEKIGGLVAEQVCLICNPGSMVLREELLTASIVESRPSSFPSRTHLPLRRDKGQEA